MKKITLGILALALAFPAIHAQEKSGKEMNKENKTYRHHPGSMDGSIVLHTKIKSYPRAARQAGEDQQRLPYGCCRP